MTNTEDLAISDLAAEPAPELTEPPTIAAPDQHGSAISSFRAIWLVARREIRTRLATRSFRAITGLLALAALAAVLAANHFGGTTAPLAIGSTNEELTQTVQGAVHQSGMNATVGTVSNMLSGEQALRDETLDALVTTAVDGNGFEVIVYQRLNPALQTLFDSIARESLLADQIRELGGDPSTIAETVAQAHAPVTTLDTAAPLNTASFVLAYLTGVLMFISLMLGAQVVAQGVVEEKSSRVVEVLLATLKPWELMAGKVVGIGIAILIQVGTVVAVAAAAATWTGLLADTGLELGWMLLWSLAWFLIGFATFAVLFAALASLVSRQEELGSVVTPVTMLMLLPYFIGLSVLPQDPHNSLGTALSFVPFFAPFLMPIRVALGVASGWQMGAALLVSLAALPLLIWLAGRIYQNAVLKTGGRTKLKDALRPA